MTNYDTWKSWIDDLPLDGFDEGKDGLQDFITQLETERNDAMALFHAADNKLQELKAERDAALAGAVRVKPLEWEVTDWSAGSGVKGEDDIAWEAQTCLNSWGYGIEWLGGDKFELSMDDGARTAFKSLPEAKAAAQADYDARIRAAMKPDPERLVAWQDVLAERQRQISAEGWTPEHDDEHDGGELAGAAASYAINAACILSPYEGFSDEETPTSWPSTWDEAWWKPSKDDPRRDLVKAGALILAEIERLDREALKGGA